MAPADPKVLYHHQLFRGPRASKKRPNASRRPELTIDQILTWADEYHDETGKWPTSELGKVGRFINETWGAIDHALSRGYRGLPGGTSLVRLLAKERGVRNRRNLPSLTVKKILSWIDAHRNDTGEWPGELSGPIQAAPGESWGMVNKALSYGLRGLAGGSSIARLLTEHRGVRSIAHLPPLSVEEILSWADAYKSRTGNWPKVKSGAIAEAPRETWTAVNQALRVGVRGLPGGSSLPCLLAENRDVRNRVSLPRLDDQLILLWADDHHSRTGQWPTTHCGTVYTSPGETWNAIDSALRAGTRGYPGRSSLARLLAKLRGVPNRMDLSPLTTSVILDWADLQYNRTGKWPNKTSGPIEDAPGENWLAVDGALARGSRGLSGGSSLAQLLSAHRGVRSQRDAPPFRIRQILEWADSHHRRTGRWPTHTSGPIIDAPEETWSAVQTALQIGLRGLPGGSSLARVLAKHRGRRNTRDLPPLSEELIWEWADNHHQLTGLWPVAKSGAVSNDSGETWLGLNAALERGIRGLSGGSSLAVLLAKHGRKRNRLALPRLTEKLIVIWAKAHRQRNGHWPTRSSGAILEAPGETWSAVDAALQAGSRGLPGGLSLARLREAAGSKHSEM